MKPLLKKLRKIRRKRKISYLEVEKHTGIPPEKMKKVEEEGLEHLTIRELDRLLALYEVSYEDVMSFDRSKFSRHLAKVMVPVLLIGMIFLYYAVTPDASFPFHSSATLGDAQEPVFPFEMKPPGPEDNHGNDSPRSTEFVYKPDLNEILDPVNPSDSLTMPQPVDQSKSEPEAPQEQLPATLAQEETITFRFWGDIPYDAAELPQISDHASQRVIDIVPVEFLSDVQPDWLEERDLDQLIINAGTSDVWTPTTIEAYQQLKENQFQVIGLGTATEVYEPYVLEFNGFKIGFLPLAGLIHNAEEIALPSRIGLARAYRTDEVLEVVRQAKSQVDFLFVLTHWGKKWTDELNMSQKVIAPAIAEGGADMIIGNHPYQSQDMTVIDGTPVFYALGHSVFKDFVNNAYLYNQISYNYVVEVEFSDQIHKTRLWVGKMNDGKLDFQLTKEDEKHLKETIGEKELLFENFEIVDESFEDTKI